MTTLLILFLCVLFGIPAVQSIGFMFDLYRIREYDGYMSDDGKIRSRKASYRTFFRNIRQENAKVVRVADLFSLFFIWGYIPYLIGRVFELLKKLWKKI